VRNLSAGQNDNLFIVLVGSFGKKSPNTDS